MALKKKWKRFGKATGEAFTNFGKSVAKTAKVVFADDTNEREENGKTEIANAWRKTGKSFGEAGKSLGKAAQGTAQKVVGVDDEEDNNKKEKNKMSKILLTGVDGNLGSHAAEILLKLEPKENLIFVAYSAKALEKYKAMGIETRVADFNYYEGLEEAFKGADILGLISMPFVGPKRQAAQKNVVDAAKAAGVKKIVYTSLVNAGDETNPSVEKKDHIYTERYIEASDLDYIFLRNSQYAEAMITNYFTYVHLDNVLKNSQGDGLMAYISRKDCAKAMAYALHRGFEPQYHKATLDINGLELMTISKFIEYGNKATGNNVSYKELTDEENYQIFDAMGVPRTTDGVFKKGSEAPFSSDGMVTFAQAIREGKMAVHTDDFKKLTGDDPISVYEMFSHSDEYQIGERHSKDK